MYNGKQFQDSSHHDSESLWKTEGTGGEITYRVVVVDDEPFMLEGMRLMIDWSRCGFKLCGEAGTVQEALHLLDTVKPHLLLTDIRMPGMLGTDLASIVSHYHPEVMILFFSGFRDFSYAQSAIRAHAFGYLTKPIDADKVHETLLKVKAELDQRCMDEQGVKHQTVILRDMVLRRIALGDDSLENQIRVSALMQIKRDDPCYCAVLAFERHSLSEGARLLLANCGAVPFQLSARQYGLGFRQIERDLALLGRLAASIAETADEVTLSVGCVHRGAEGFGQSLREALDAQGVLFTSMDSIRLYHPFDIETASWLASVRISALHEALLDKQPQSLETALEKICHAVASSMPSLFSLRYLAFMLDALLVSDTRFPSESPLRALWRQETHSVSEWLDAFSRELCALQAIAAQNPDTMLPAAVQTVLSTIHDRYAEPLSISVVAELLHMNAAYLGQLFRRHTGETFHQKLLTTRISHACVLLRQTTRPIGEIASDVGFHDVDYFSQQFRGRVGMSPFMFRNAEAMWKGDILAKHQ